MFSVELCTSYISDVNAPCQIKDEGKIGLVFISGNLSWCFRIIHMAFFLLQVFDATKLYFNIMRWINTSKVKLFISKRLCCLLFRLFQMIMNTPFEYLANTGDNTCELCMALIRSRKDYCNITTITEIFYVLKRRHGGFGCYSHKSCLSDKVIPY